MGFFARLGFLRETADFLKIFVKTIQLQEDLIISFCNTYGVKYRIIRLCNVLGRGDKRNYDFPFPKVLVHSANPIGSANMMGYINNFLMNETQPQTCVRVNIPHTYIEIIEDNE